jgi:ornithine carrier protein
MHQSPQPTVTAEIGQTQVTQSTFRLSPQISDLLCGSAAGMVSKVVEHPFDTIKVRLQTQNLFGGPLDCFRATVRHEGFMGLYKGLSAPVFGAMVENAALFFSYRQCQTLIKNLTPGQDPATDLSLTQLGLAGGMAGVVASLFLTPIELVKCRLQVCRLQPKGMEGVKTTPLGVIADTLKKQGVAGFYRGHLGTMMRESGGGMCYFGMYEMASAYFLNQQRIRANDPTISKEQLHPLSLMTSGALAGMVFNLSLFPADVIKSKMQTEIVPEGQPRKSFAAIGREIYRSQGIKGFYRGCGITVLRSIPSNALIFFTYEKLSQLLK